MKQEGKELLLKDLCGRLSYGVKMNHVADNDITQTTLVGIAKNMITLEDNGGYATANIDEYKPYLFPLSFMTEEIQDEIYKETGLYDILDEEQIHIEVGTNLNSICKIFHIFNKYHLDYNGLIPMGLAIDATGLNIY